MLAKMNKWSTWVTETRPDVIHSHYRSLLLQSGFTIVDEMMHVFDPQGFTSLILLSESHFAIHTFPERGKSYVELSSCVDGPFERFVSAHDMETTTGDV